jgi:hypothetical protein
MCASYNDPPVWGKSDREHLGPLLADFGRVASESTHWDTLSLRHKHRNAGDHMLSFGQFLKRPPITALLQIIAITLTVHVALGTLLATNTRLLWWQSYLIAASSGISVGLLFAWRCYRRLNSRDS